MKKIRIIFILYLIVNLACLLYINIYLLKVPFLEYKELSDFGECFLNLRRKIDSIPKFIEHPIKFYTNLTGTNRGYEFFSPNVSKSSSKLIFISDKGKEIQLLKSLESSAKLATVTYYFNSFILDEKKRNQLLKSICARLFALNPKVKEISVFLINSKHKNLKKSTSKNHTVDSEKIELAKIKRNEN